MEDANSSIEQITNSPGFQELAPPLQIALFLGGMILLSGAMVSITAFTRIVIVLSFVRRALSTQEIPPNQVIIGLSLFLTLYVMSPTLTTIHENALTPYMQQEISSGEALDIGHEAIRAFMFAQMLREDLDSFVEATGTEVSENLSQVPSSVLIPAFMIHELKVAFIMGFCIYVPFLLIDIVISTVLMSLGMMMMPPVIISTPCKLLLFVLVDGWTLVTASLSQSFWQPGMV